MEPNNESNNYDKIVVGCLFILFVLFITLVIIGTKLAYNTISGKQTSKQEFKINKNNFRLSFDFMKNLEISKNIIEDINSNDIQKRKAIFNDILKAYQEAFCTEEEKTVKLPDDLYETLAISLPDSGSSHISIDEFINTNYAGASQHQRIAIKQILIEMKEVSGIRLWDISKSVIAYSILKSNKIDLTRENILKAKNCMNGKIDFKEIENHFYEMFKLSRNNTHKILISLCDNDWMSAQTNFGSKFLNRNDVTYMTIIKERRIKEIKKSINEFETNSKAQLAELENSLHTDTTKSEIEQLEQEIEKRKLEIEIKRQEQDLNRKKQELQRELEKLKQQEELEKAESESDFKYPKNVDKSVISTNKGEKVHIVSLYEAANSVKCYNEGDCNRKGIVTIHVTDKTAPVNLILTSYESVLWNVIAENGVKINKIYVGSYYQDRVKAPKGTLVYNLPDRLYLHEDEYFVIEDKFDKKVLTFQFNYKQSEITVDGVNGKIAPAKRLNLNHKILSDITSNNVQTKKALFYEMVTIYQNAFCKSNAKNVKLPNNLYEKLSSTIPNGGSATISINKFIDINYKNLSNDEKTTITEVLEEISELNGKIRQWDIGKSVISYAILKSAQIPLTKENLQKGLKCMNGKWNSTELEKDFYKTFYINPKDVHKVLSLLSDEDWSSIQTSFSKKFLNVSD